MKRRTFLTGIGSVGSVMGLSGCTDPEPIASLIFIKDESDPTKYYIQMDPRNLRTMYRTCESIYLYRDRSENVIFSEGIESAPQDHSLYYNTQFQYLRANQLSDERMNMIEEIITNEQDVNPFAIPIQVQIDNLGEEDIVYIAVKSNDTDTFVQSVSLQELTVGDTLPVGGQYVFSSDSLSQDEFFKAR